MFYDVPQRYDDFLSCDNAMQGLVVKVSLVYFQSWLFVWLLVSRISQKVVNRFSCSLVERRFKDQMIQIHVWGTLDHSHYEICLFAYHYVLLMESLTQNYDLIYLIFYIFALQVISTYIIQIK